MGIREAIMSYIPLVIPELRNDDGTNRIYFGFIPEDEEKRQLWRMLFRTNLARWI